MRTKSAQRSHGSPSKWHGRIPRHVISRARVRHRVPAGRPAERVVVPPPPLRYSPLDDTDDLTLLRLEPAAGPRRTAAIAAVHPSL